MVTYNPTKAPTDTIEGGQTSESTQSMIQWIQNELEAIAKALGEFDITSFKVLNVAPARPREGNIAFADGTNWNPGGGRGFYEYRSGAWQKL